MKELLVVRHGRSKQNVGVSDDLDDGLTEFGRKQAAIVAKFIKSGLVKYKDHELETHKATIYVSPYLRTLQTASFLHDHFPETNVVVRGEIGEYVNHFNYPEIKVPRRTYFSSYNWDHYDEHVYNQEHHNDKWHLKRLLDFYESLSADTPNIIVSHGFPCLTLLNIGLGKTDKVPQWDFSISNASLSWVKNNEVIWWGRNLYHETENIAEFNEK